jgi:hypothetical protein
VGSFVSNDDDSAGPPVRILDGRLFRSFIKNVALNTWEDVDEDDNYLLDAVSREALPPSVSADTSPQKRHFKRVPSSIADTSYEYEFVYTRDHTKPRCSTADRKLSNFCPAATTCILQLDGTGECK